MAEGQEFNSDVGVSELRDNLSRYVEHAAHGNDVTITVRGKPVARLVPAGPDAPFAELRRRGLIRESTRPKGATFQRQAGPPLSSRPVSGAFLRRWR